MSYQLMELAVVAHTEAGRSDQDRQVEYLQDKLFGNLPRKLWPAEVAIRGCFLVDRPLQIQFPDNDSWTQIKVLVDNTEQLCLWFQGGTVGEQRDGQRPGHSDGVRHLNQDSPAQLGFDQRLGHPASSVGSRAVDL